ncbi:Arc family DNA-binding protein [Pseudoflavonifractor sp. HCP28S3_F10]|uniref:Arc family DNA-binding protein n=1 Tax=Pseudoflavonifractor sp. HCP28S3_F10 TaxID=3438947 RepID=UPI003F8AC7C2
MSVSYNFPLRLDDELREKLRYIAAQNSRSLNKEIEYLVKKHVEAYEKEHGPIAVPKE